MKQLKWLYSWRVPHWQAEYCTLRQPTRDISYVPDVTLADSGLCLSWTHRALWAISAGLISWRQPTLFTWTAAFDAFTTFYWAVYIHTSNKKLLSDVISPSSFPDLLMIKYLFELFCQSKLCKRIIWYVKMCNLIQQTHVRLSVLLHPLGLFTVSFSETLF